ncbi:unnamed protein product [Ostreobium quekettii]|uniref:Uncharacterized protein n=1 Tax=Ostreobium quekettii TaxID=121088 RepID=A0A8S1J6P8_9CHLO|nr:unnamed protein product [Ostreobium quekettii]
MWAAFTAVGSGHVGSLHNRFKLSWQWFTLVLVTSTHSPKGLSSPSGCSAILWHLCSHNLAHVCFECVYIFSDQSGLAVSAAGEEHSLSVHVNNSIDFAFASLTPWTLCEKDMKEPSILRFCP